MSVAVAGATDSASHCGETLSASCLQLLTRLGIGDEFRCEHHLPLQGVRSAWGSNEVDEHSSLFNPYGESVILDRMRLGLRMERLFRNEGGVVIEGRIQDVRVERGEHLVTLRTRQDCQQIRAKALIDATGIAARVARRLGAQRIIQTRQVALGWCIEAPPGTSDLPTTAIIEGVESGWLFAVPVQRSRAAVWFVCDPVLATQGDGLKRALRESREVSRWLNCFDLVPTGEPAVRNASVGRLDRVAGDGWVAVGDAALSLDPLSSSGITLAILSGMHGARAIAASVAGNDDRLAEYVQTLQDAAKHHAKLRQQFYRAERRWPNADFWMNRQGLARSTSEDRHDSRRWY
ncbi:flavin-dependent dehydrogenase [Paraburkholderia sp. JPY162]|uniref:Flavin-dependent dehydrogenase n=1 Tax=Paraburkholderia youngii TaxID=2782701 RepID=A0A7W8L936_9BURK|nr:flavin-dependent dehydrogenase [Paraburkholderia youngii]